VVCPLLTRIVPMPEATSVAKLKGLILKGLQTKIEANDGIELGQVNSCCNLFSGCQLMLGLPMCSS
jgi:hypothetical protein